MMLSAPVPSAMLMPVYPASSSIAALTASAPVDMPLASVMTALESQAAFNNTKNTAQTRQAAVQAAPVAPSPLSFSGLMQESSSSPLTFSSAFMAQWIAQSSPSEAVSIAQLYANDNVPDSTLDSRLMEIYSLVKYKPSLAGRPSPEPMNIPPLAANPAPAVKMVKPEIMAANPIFGVFQRAAQARAEAVSASPAAGVGALPRKPVAQNDNVETAPAANDAAPKISFGSLIKESGVRAYQASFARNQANLAAEKPESQYNS